MYLKYLVLLLYYGITIIDLVGCEVAKNVKQVPNVVQVNKCCEKEEIYIGESCQKVNETMQWHPLFTDQRGNTNVQINNYTLVTGSPDCGHMQRWSIYHYKNSPDRLILLPDGVLRHYTDEMATDEEFEIEAQLDNGNARLFFDYLPGKYCMDKKIEETEREFARVCVPDQTKFWTSNEFFMHNIISPITHGITIICLLIIAIIYFIMPTLRDLTGNIVTTVCMCLIVSQTADMIRLLTVFKSHISLLIAETICYVSLLGAFFWLNSLGYYIWKTFRSRNVFLRITDGKKYCYYCAYVWSSTFILGFLAVFAHFTMDYPEIKPSITFDKQQEQIGSLGMIIFFVPVAITVLVNVIFFATTLKKINKMNTYGRIHHKLRHSFRMFLLLFLLMTLCWLFFLSSFSKFEGLINSHIVVNTFLGPLMLYICIFNQKHVSYLIRKTCCYANCICPCCRPEQDIDWGDEMTAMNTGSY